MRLPPTPPSQQAYISPRRSGGLIFPHDGGTGSVPPPPVCEADLSPRVLFSPTGPEESQQLRPPSAQSNGLHQRQARESSSSGAAAGALNAAALPSALQHPPNEQPQPKIVVPPGSAPSPDRNRGLEWGRTSQPSQRDLRDIALKEHQRQRPLVSPQAPQAPLPSHGRGGAVFEGTVLSSTRSASPPRWAEEPPHDVSPFGFGSKEKERRNGAASTASAAAPSTSTWREHLSPRLPCSTVGELEDERAFLLRATVAKTDEEKARLVRIAVVHQEEERRAHLAREEALITAERGPTERGAFGATSTSSPPYPSSPPPPPPLATQQLSSSSAAARETSMASQLSPQAGLSPHRTARSADLSVASREMALAPLRQTDARGRGQVPDLAEPMLMEARTGDHALSSPHRTEGPPALGQSTLGGSTRGGPPSLGSPTGMQAPTPRRKDGTPALGRQGPQKGSSPQQLSPSHTGSSSSPGSSLPSAAYCLGGTPPPYGLGAPPSSYSNGSSSSPSRRTVSQIEEERARIAPPVPPRTFLEEQHLPKSIGESRLLGESLFAHRTVSQIELDRARLTQTRRKSSSSGSSVGQIVNRK